MRKIIFGLILTVVLEACHKDVPITTLPTDSGVYIVNEGNFNFGNGEISFYNPTTNQVTNNLFQAANHYLLGDIAESMFIKDSIAFIVVNNSAKIEVVKIPSLQKIKTISIAGSSPRYILPVNDSIAYVTELYAKKIWVINYIKSTVVTTISTQGWTENICKIDNDIYVQQEINTLLPSSFAAIIKINSSNYTTQYNNTFNGRNITGMVKDNLNRIWISVDEDAANNLHAGFYCFDRNLVEQKSFFFSDFNHHPSRLCTDAEGENLLFIDKDIFRFYINDNAVPLTKLISGAGENIYTMDIDPTNDDIYVSDALDYTQSSRIYRFDKNGGLIHSFTAGIISGNFAFNNE